MPWGGAVLFTYSNGNDHEGTSLCIHAVVARCAMIGVNGSFMSRERGVIFCIPYQVVRDRSRQCLIAKAVTGSESRSE
jgi:hypothetical protein